MPRVVSDLATYIATGAIINEGPTTRTFGPIHVARITGYRVGGCAMDHSRNCDKHGEKKLESSWLHLYGNVIGFVRVFHISGIEDILWERVVTRRIWICLKYALAIGRLERQG